MATMWRMDTPATPPDATLFIATGCAHCPAVLQALSDLLKQGAIGRLEVVNIAVHPENAREQGIRSVPWTRIGPFTLHGMQTAAELRRWVERAGSEEGAADYLAELLENQRLAEAVELALDDSAWSVTAVQMLGDLETPMGVRIGIGALLEDLAEQNHYAAVEPELRKLLQSPDAPVRADAAYYLGLSANPEARSWLEPLLQDPDHEVREIVREALEQA